MLSGLFWSISVAIRAQGGHSFNPGYLRKTVTSHLYWYQAEKAFREIASQAYDIIGSHVYFELPLHDIRNVRLDAGKSTPKLIVACEGAACCLEQHLEIDARIRLPHNPTHRWVQFVVNRYLHNILAVDSTQRRIPNFAQVSGELCSQLAVDELTSLAIQDFDGALQLLNAVEDEHANNTPTTDREKLALLKCAAEDCLRATEDFFAAASFAKIELSQNNVAKAARMIASTWEAGFARLQEFGKVKRQSNIHLLHETNAGLKPDFDINGRTSAIAIEAARDLLSDVLLRVLHAVIREGGEVTLGQAPSLELSLRNDAASCRSAISTVELHPYWLNTSELWAGVATEYGRACRALDTGNAVLDPAVPPVSPATDLDSLDLKILSDLARRKGLAAALVEIEAATKITRKTVGLRLKRLAEMGYAKHPKGKRILWVITPAGTERLSQLTNDARGMGPQISRK